jgi:LPXTG-motif cell wall-anchored protein
VTPAPAAPVAADPAPATPPPVAETVPAPVEAAAETGNARLWLVLAGLGLAAAAIAAFLLLRRRREDDVDAEPAYAEPAYAAEPEPVAPAIAEPDPVAAAPLFTPQPATAPRHDAHPALEHATLSHADAEDIDAVLGGGTPHGDRPQLELAMRPTRAGLNRDDAVVEFELTVANAGGVAAEDVRIGAFMLSGETGERSQIEQLLINPPAELVVDAESIAPGDGTRLDAAITVPRDILSLHEDGDHSGFTPVLLADARYRLPDGSEGRTAAAFTIGRVNGGEALVPIGIEDAAMYDDIEARLHSVPAKV